MSRTWDLPSSGSTTLKAAVTTNTPDALRSLQSMFSGSGAPTATVAYMQYVDTADGLVKQRNAGDSGSVVVAPALHDLGQRTVIVSVGALSASTNIYIGSPHQKSWKVLRVRVISDTASTGSDGSNNWEFQVRNKTQTEDMLSTATSTNGSEIAADTPFDVVTDQNETAAVDDVLELQITKTGSATTLARVSIQVEFTISV